jgi:hypothetical protein
MGIASFVDKAATPLTVLNNPFMKILSTLAIVLFATLLSSIACKNHKAAVSEQIAQTVTAYIKQELRDQDSTLTLDSVRTLHIDTLTVKDRLLYKVHRCSYVGDSLTREMDYVNSIGKIHLRQAELYSDLSPKLKRMALDDVWEDTAKMGNY